MTIENSKQFSDFIVYVDESGDHGLVTIDPDYPMFVLVFCIFNKKEYINNIIPALAQFKMRFWGHNEYVLHEHDIRKPRDEFTILFNKSVRETFLNELNELMSNISVTIIASVINKKDLLSKYITPDNPYEISLSFGLERIYRYLDDAEQSNSRTSIIVERRGKKEDASLELVFRRICDGSNFLNKRFPYDIVMIDKKSNSAGLQIADLTARPIGLKTLRPNQPNRAYDIIETKLRKSPTGNIRGWGIKEFP